MTEIRVLRPVPFLCRMGFHWREWTASIRRVDITAQAQLNWFTTDKPMEGLLHVSRGKCKRCTDMISYYTVYDVEESL